MEAILHDFYAQLRQGVILGRQCGRCGLVAFPPRGLCGSCGSSDSNWVEMSGDGRLLFASSGPNLVLGSQYVMATVELQEGPIVAGVLLDDSLDLSHPEKIWDYCDGDIVVSAEIHTNPRGVVGIAFRVV